MAVNLADLGKAGFRTESDVEQKLILPLLTASEWLAIPTTDIQTKQYLPPTQIDKGAGRRIGYYPDYSIWISAVPIMIVEAKSPIESAEEGFREAQLYAHELNKVFPTGINPVQFVLCVNGRNSPIWLLGQRQDNGPVCCRSQARFSRASLHTELHRL